MQQRLRQNGQVRSIEPHIKHGSLLQVNHFPPLNFLAIGKDPLPVKLTGVQVNANGLAWLQSVVVDHRVQFVPLVKHDDYVECLVLLSSATAKGKAKEIDVAEALLSLGFARTADLPPRIPHDKRLERYYMLLHVVEQRAMKRRHGEWDWRLPQPWLPKRLWRLVMDTLIGYITPQSRRLPELVRP